MDMEQELKENTGEVAMIYHPTITLLILRKKGKTPRVIATIHP